MSTSSHFIKNLLFIFFLLSTVVKVMTESTKASQTGILWALNPAGPADQVTINIISLNGQNNTAQLTAKYQVAAPMENSQAHGLLVTPSTVYLGYSMGYNISGPPYQLIAIDRSTGAISRLPSLLPSQPYQLYGTADGGLYVAYPDKQYPYLTLAQIDPSSGQIVKLIARFAAPPSPQSSGQYVFGSWSVNMFGTSLEQIFFTSGNSTMDPSDLSASCCNAASLACSPYVTSTPKSPYLPGPSLIFSVLPSSSSSSSFSSSSFTAYTLSKRSDVMYLWGLSAVSANSQQVSVAPPTSFLPSNYFPGLSPATSPQSIYSTLESTSFFASNPKIAVFNLQKLSSPPQLYDIPASSWTRGWGMDLFWSPS